jgi:hypothetical protein
MYEMLRRRAAKRAGEDVGSFPEMSNEAWAKLGTARQERTPEYELQMGRPKISPEYSVTGGKPELSPEYEIAMGKPEFIEPKAYQNPSEEELVKLVASGEIDEDFADELRTRNMPRSFPPSGPARPREPMPLYAASGPRLSEQLAARVGATTGTSGEVAPATYAASGKPRKEEIARPSIEEWLKRRK